MQKRLWMMGLTALLAAIVLLTGCSGGSKQKITIGEVTRSIFYAPQYVALTKGFFADEGLEVELTTTPGGDRTMTALLSGNIDIALVGSETSIYVYAQGSENPVINFAQLTQTDGTFLVSREPIENFSWEMLRGVTFLGQRKGGMPQMAGEFTLKKHDIDPHKDMELLQNIDFANIPAAFASGIGDFVQLFEPQATVFEQEGRGKVVASFGTESGRLPYTVFMARQSYIEQNKELIQKFTNAVHRAQIWVQTASLDEVTDAVLPYFEDTERDIVKRVIERYRSQGSYAEDPIIDVEEWNNLLDIMEEAGELPARVDHAAIIDNSFAVAAIRHVSE